MSEFEPRSERLNLSPLTDSGKGRKRTWRRTLWKVLGYSSIAAFGLLALSAAV